jgi:4,5-dihydroxyphthalate decarboxylase
MGADQEDCPMAAPDTGSVAPLSVSETARAADKSPALYPLDVAIADYDRTRALIDGRVKAEGLAIKTFTPEVRGDFCTRPVYEAFDASEMSFSWYLEARDRDAPCLALPVFPMRMAVWAYVFVRADSNIEKPSDLIGKRIGAQGYRYTVNLWLRGIFEEHYGLKPQDTTWVTAETENNGYAVPKGIDIELRPNSDPVENLKTGVVDAIYCTGIPKEFENGESWIRRLFPDAQSEMRSFVGRTGIMPITHIFVMKKQLAEREPWIAQSLYRAFVESQQATDRIYTTDAKLMSLPESVFIVEQQKALYGASPYAHGLAANRKIVETFVRYAHAQGYISRPIPVDELFVPATVNL